MTPRNKAQGKVWMLEKHMYGKTENFPPASVQSDNKMSVQRGYYSGLKPATLLMNIKIILQFGCYWNDIFQTTLKRGKINSDL